MRGGLQDRRELERVPRDDSVVVVAGREQDGRVAAAGMDVVQRGVRADPAVLLGVAGVPVVTLPGPPDREAVESEHVEHAHVCHGGAEETGCWVMHAPTRRPPFEAPLMAMRRGRDHPEAPSHLAQSQKSSKTLCLFASIPALCHERPYSPPPRRTAMAKRPPRSTKAAQPTLNSGVIGMSKPP